MRPLLIACLTLALVSGTACLLKAQQLVLTAHPQQSPSAVSIDELFARF